MIVIDGKEYRNLEEQVLKNMEDIETLKEEQVDILNEDNTFTGNNTFNGNLYRPNTNGGGQLIVNNVMAGVSYSDDGDQTGQVAVTSAGTSITGLVSPTNDNDAANKQYVDNQLSAKLDKSGGTMTGNIGFGTGLSINPPANTSVFNGIQIKGNVRLDNGLLYMNGKRIALVATPSADTDAANKKYVDDQIATVDTSTCVQKSGDTMTGTLNMGDNAITLGSHTIQNISANNYLDVSGTVRFLSSTVYGGNLNITGKKITNLGTPTTGTDAANKQYVDDQIATIDTSNYVQKSNESGKLYGTDANANPYMYTVSNGVAGNLVVSRKYNGQITLPQTPAIDTDAASKAYVDSVATASGSTYTVQVKSNYTNATVTYGWKIGKMIIFYGQFNDGLNLGANSITIASTDTISHGYIQSGDNVMAFGNIHDNYATFDEEVGATTGGSVFNGRNFVGVIWLA